MSSATLIRGARVVTPEAVGVRGPAIGRLRIIPGADVLLRGGLIERVEPAGTIEGAPGVEVVDAAGCVLIPGFVDCHTHLCWAGSRIDEWQRKLAGEPYLEILRSGGGIMATVRAVRAAREHELEALTLERLGECLELGTTTVEVKSGYGLTTADELKMLRAVRSAAGRWGGTVVQTALLGHAIDPEQPGFVERTIRETLPAVHAEFPGIAVDVYVESGAWSLEDARRLLEAALGLGHAVRLHVDQFHSLGGLPLGIELGARSVDHLEASKAEDLVALAASDVAAVALPICGMHLDGRYAALRGVIDAGGRVAIATNCNPGSAPSASMPLAMALAVRHGGLSPSEALSAATAGGAQVLALPDRGVIAAGLRADVCLLRMTDERELAYRLGVSVVRAVWCGGRRAARRE